RRCSTLVQSGTTRARPRRCLGARSANMGLARRRDGVSLLAPVPVDPGYCSARRSPHRDRRDLMERRTESAILSLACGNGASKIVINALFIGLVTCELLVNKGAQR